MYYTQGLQDFRDKAILLFFTIVAWKNINFHVLKFCKLTSLTSFVLFAFRRQKLDEIKRRKLQELREAGVPDKYCNEVARRIEAPPPSLSRMY